MRRHICLMILRLLRLQICMYVVRRTDNEITAKACLIIDETDYFVRQVQKVIRLSELPDLDNNYGPGQLICDMRVRL